MPKFVLPTNLVRVWFSPALTVFLVGCLLSIAAAVALRQDDLNQLRTDFELRSASAISFIQFESSRAYSVNVANDLNAMADEIAEQGIDAAFPSLQRYASGTRNIIWVPALDATSEYDSNLRVTSTPSSHPLLDDFNTINSPLLSGAQYHLPIERIHSAEVDALDILGLEFASHDITGLLLQLAREFDAIALYSRYSSPSEELNLPYMNLRLHLKPVFETGNGFLGFVGIIALSNMSTTLVSGFSPPGGVELVSLENRESNELRTALAATQSLVGGSRADRGSGPTDIVTVAQPEYLDAAETSRPLFAFGGGFLFSLLVAGYVRLSRVRTEQIGRLVSKRTMELTRSNNQLQMEILEREKAEATLRESEEKYRLLAEHITDIIWKCDLRLHLTYSSPSSLVVLGYTEQELIDISWNDLFTPHSLETLISRTQSDKNWSYTSGKPVPEHLLELQFIRKDGHQLNCEVHFRMYLNDDKQPVGYVGVTRDITQRKEQEAEKHMLEAQLFQARKMEAIGSLAGGVAHDFNNLLTGIMGYSTLLESRTDLEPDIKKASTVITAAAERGRKLTQNLLGFARKGKFENKSLDFAAIVSEVATLLKQTTDASIQIHWQSDGESYFVYGDPDQLHLSVMNLIVNARDSLEDGGNISLALKKTTSSHEQFLEFSVCDDGPGIPDEIKDRIFEPFFTTKEQGQGTGLGLATVYGIVEHHGGKIRVDSKTGVGTTFTIELPLVDAAQSDDTDANAGPQVGKGNILVVDDDDDVRDAVSFILESLGYDTCLARDGQDAVDVYTQNADDIDLVLLDWRMPGMNGKECFQKLREFDPDVIAILTTGYGQDGMVQELVKDGIHGFIRKPYRTQELADVVATAMRKSVELSKQAVG